MKVPLNTPWLCCLLGALVFLTGCEKPPAPTAEDYLPAKKFKVVASTLQLAELATQLGGDAVTVECLLNPKRVPPPDETVNDRPPWDPNPFKLKLRAADLFAMQSAHLVILNGLGVESKLEQEIPKLREQGVKVVVVGDSIPAEDRIMLPDSTQVDPCYWNSPRMWKHAVSAVTAGLQQLVRPEAADYFDNRAHPVNDKLNRLMTWAEEKLAATKPKGQRFVLSSHNTLAYFARDFAIETRALWSVQDGSFLAKDEAAMLAWLELHEVSDYVIDVSVPQDLALIDLSAKFGIFATKPIYSIFPDRPGTKQLGKMESFDVGTYEGVFQQMIRVIEHRLGGSRVKNNTDAPAAAAESKPADRLAPAPEPEPKK